MKESNPMSLIEKLHKVNAEITKIDKGGVNTFSKYSYIRLGDILDKLRPILQEVGLIVTQSATPLSNEFIEHKDKYYTSSSVSCETTVYDVESQQSKTVYSIGYSLDANGDKAAYKAITGARKYGLSCLFCLDWDAVEPEDDKYDDKRFKPAATKTLPGKRVF